MELSLKTPPTLFVRIKGEKGERELQAVLDTGSAYSVISTKDAFQLGHEVYYDPMEDYEKFVQAVTISYLIKAPLITLQQVRVGDLVAKDVAALVYDIPELGGVDVVLGASFLKSFKITIDYKKGTLTIEK